MRKHMETQHGVFNLYLPPTSKGGKDKEPWTFLVRTNQRGEYPCPANCPFLPARDFWELRQHFCLRHPQHTLECPRRGILARCRSCGMQTLEAAFVGGHESSAACHRMAARWTQHEAAKTAHEALSNKFTAYSIKLKHVEEFKYLERPTSFINSDVPVLRHILKKAQGVWQRISLVL